MNPTLLIVILQLAIILLAGIFIILSRYTQQEYAKLVAEMRENNKRFEDLYSQVIAVLWESVRIRREADDLLKEEAR